jgi:hypothetical protein
MPCWLAGSRHLNGTLLITGRWNNIQDCFPLGLQHVFLWQLWQRLGVDFAFACSSAFSVLSMVLHVSALCGHQPNSIYSAITNGVREPVPPIPPVLSSPWFVFFLALFCSCF